MLIRKVLASLIVYRSWRLCLHNMLYACMVIRVQRQGAPICYKISFTLLCNGCLAAFKFYWYFFRNWLFVLWFASKLTLRYCIPGCRFDVGTNSSRRQASYLWKSIWKRLMNTLMLRSSEVKPVTWPEEFSLSLMIPLYCLKRWASWSY